MGGGTNITSSCSQKEHGMYKEQKGQLGRKQREACGELTESNHRL